MTERPVPQPALRIPAESGTPAAASIGDRAERSLAEHLSLKIFYPDAIATDEIYSYNEAFSFWYEIWLETRQEVDETLTTPPDSFSRQSEILVLYSDRKPIATCCHRYVDLRHHCVIYDSYFTTSIWPASVKSRIPGLGQSCVLGSHIFIDPAFRKSRSGLPIKNIVCALSMTHVNATRPDVLLGAARIDRGIHKVFHEAGALSLSADASWYHIPVDLIAMFPKRSPMRIDAKYEDIVRSIGKTCHRFAVNYLQRTLAT
jgi:hypothetical protein